jgi:hypothetical protein
VKVFPVKPLALVCAIFVAALLVRSYLDSTDPDLPGGGRARQTRQQMVDAKHKMWSEYFKTIVIPPPPGHPKDDARGAKFDKWVDRETKTPLRHAQRPRQLENRGSHSVVSTFIELRSVGRTVLGPPFQHWFIKITVDPPIQPGEKWFMSYDLRLDDEKPVQTGIVCAFQSKGGDSIPISGCKPFPELEHENDGRLGSWIEPKDVAVDGLTLGVMTGDMAARLKWLAVDGRLVYGSRSNAKGTLGAPK